MEHPDITRARSALDRCKGQWDTVAARSGVSYSWLSKFFNGHVENPGANTLQKVIVACDELGAPPQGQPH
jgi:transcriptional regulator with XRE-family HTH domain